MVVVVVVVEAVLEGAVVVVASGASLDTGILRVSPSSGYS